MRIYFATHGASEDNEAGVASGWKDAGLSETGVCQARELGERFAGIPIDLVCCSDLMRASTTVEIAFANRIPIVGDARLREVNYGDLNGADRDLVFGMKAACIDTPYPNGESCRQAVGRVHDFLRELILAHPGETVLIVGHRATHHGLDTFTGQLTLEECVAAPFEWQPYWVYDLPDEGR
jgi:broad specificity phosphatase PhoE